MTQTINKPKYAPNVNTPRPDQKTFPQSAITHIILCTVFSWPISHLTLHQKWPIYHRSKQKRTWRLQISTIKLFIAYLDFNYVYWREISALLCVYGWREGGVVFFFNSIYILLLFFPYGRCQVGPSLKSVNSFEPNIRAKTNTIKLFPFIAPKSHRRTFRYYGTSLVPLISID